MMVTLQLWLVITIFQISQAKLDQAKDAELPAVCGRNNVNRIVGGQQAIPHSWPWQAAIHELPYWSNDTTDDSFNFICGGSVINQRYILCAAHCVSSYGEVTKAKNLKVMLGAHNRTKNDGQWYSVSKIIVHPKYNDSSMQYDISLFRLETSIDFSKSNKSISPVCVADNSVSKENLNGVSSVITGWGTLEPMGDVSPVLMQVSVPIVSQEKCVKVYDKESITKLNVCAGLDEGKKDSCQGDSGGPLSIRRKNCWTQVGITSWGRSCAEPNAYGVYTRVSMHYDWIVKQLLKEKKNLQVVQQIME